MKIVFFEASKAEQDIFLKSFNETGVSFYEEKLNEDNTEKAKNAEIISVFVNSKISKKVIDQIPDLKFITTRSTGFDHIDIEYARTKGISVSNVPAYGSQTVAEFTFGLLLTLSRRIYWGYHQLREGNNFDLSQLEGFDLEGKILGVIGTGKIGQNVIRIAKGFRMKVIATNPNPKPELALELGFEYVSLDDLLSQSDIITIHVPYMPATHHLINSANLAKIKRGAILINTARGEIVETEALLSALNDGRIKGAALDVLEGERDLKEERLITMGSDPKIGHMENMRKIVEDHVLINLPNVIVTPHMAFFTKEAVGRIIETTVENIKGFISGTAQNIVQ
ncbi:MAG: hydroxyacid dehydrogenase [Patescibacteria group bacterium]